MSKTNIVSTQFNKPTRCVATVRNNHAGRQFIKEFRAWARKYSYTIAARGRGQRVTHQYSASSLDAIRMTLPLEFAETIALYVNYNRREFPKRPFYSYKEVCKKHANGILRCFMNQSSKYKDCIVE